MNIVIDYSLKTPAFRSGVVFTDLAMPLRINQAKTQYVVNLNFGAVDKALHNIFEWLPGQRILDPEFGNKIYRFVSEIISDVTSKNIAGGIRQMFNSEPRVQLKKVEVTPDPAQNQYSVNIEYYIPLLNQTDSTEFVIKRLAA